MKTIDDMITELLRREGGFTMDKADAAHYGSKTNKIGAKWDCYGTNMGITQATLSDWLGRQATIDEVRTLDETTARHIYETNYFLNPRFDKLPNSIQPQMFDIGVNSGTRVAVRMLQTIINQAGFGVVDTDGVLGPRTVAAACLAETSMGNFLCNALVDERKNFYLRLIQARPANEKYRNGWLARAEEFREEV